MALDVIREVSRYTIRSRPGEKFRLRAGIHTGPCAAGIFFYTTLIGLCTTINAEF
jgi:class 3 adenylate cyclase